MKTLLLTLPLLASVAGAVRLRHSGLRVHDNYNNNNHRDNPLFRRQDTCPIGYKPCPDGDCCEIGETCTQSRGVKLCAGYACDAGVQTCTANGVTACCQRVGERCHPTNPGVCTMPIGGGGGGGGGGSDDGDDGDLSFTILPVPDPTTTSSDEPEYTLKPQPDRTSSSSSSSEGDDDDDDNNVPTSTDVFTETTVETSASTASETSDTSAEEPEITAAPSASETSERETASDPPSTADQGDGAGGLVGVSLRAVVGAFAALGVGLWFL